MTVTASFNETSIAGQTSINNLTSISTGDNDIQTSKSEFLTTKPIIRTNPTGFDKSTATVKTKPDGNARNFIFMNCISLFNLKFATCMKPKILQMYFRRWPKWELWEPSESIWICYKKPGGRLYNDVVYRIIISFHDINESHD